MAAVQTGVDMDLKDLSSLSQGLNSSTDDLNTELRGIEERLNKLALGVEAWAVKQPLDESFTEGSTDHGGDPIRTRVTLELGYARFSEGWMLAVRTVHYGQQLVQVSNDHWEYYDDGQVTAYPARPLLRASRTARTKAVDCIPSLFEALHEAGSKVFDAVEKARKISESLK